MSVLYLDKINHWVFDMDGTLTFANHDFDYMRRKVGLPEGQTDILAYLATLPKPEADQKRQWMVDYGESLAREAKPAIGAIELIQYLQKQNAKLGILTRNDRNVALITLETIGLLDAFDKASILGRNEANPKPDPDGILTILKQWDCSPEEAVMVGDFHFDLNAGKNAGTQTVLVNHAENLWPEITDHHFYNCNDLLASIQSNH